MGWLMGEGRSGLGQRGGRGFYAHCIVEEEEESVEATDIGCDERGGVEREERLVVEGDGLSKQDQIGSRE